MKQPPTLRAYRARMRRHIPRLTEQLAGLHLDDLPQPTSTGPHLHATVLGTYTTDTHRHPDGTTEATLTGLAGAITGDPEALERLANQLHDAAALARFTHQLHHWDGTEGQP